MPVGVTVGVIASFVGVTKLVAEGVMDGSRPVAGRIGVEVVASVAMYVDDACGKIVDASSGAIILLKSEGLVQLATAEKNRIATLFKCHSVHPFRIRKINSPHLK